MQLIFNCSFPEFRSLFCLIKHYLAELFFFKLGGQHSDMCSQVMETRELAIATLKQYVTRSNNVLQEDQDILIEQSY